jgi:hypothetical protein
VTADEKVPRKINAGDLLHVLQIIVVIGVAFMAWQYNKDTVAHTATVVSELKPKVEEMERNGHLDHERRITKLETEKAGTTALEQQTKNIDRLTTIVTQDHDILVRLTERVSAAGK